MPQLRFIFCSFIWATPGQQMGMWRRGGEKWRELRWTNDQLRLFDNPFADTNRKCLATERLHAQYSNHALWDHLKKFACSSLGMHVIIGFPATETQVWEPNMLKCLQCMQSFPFQTWVFRRYNVLHVWSHVQCPTASCWPPFILKTTSQGENHIKCKTTAVYSSHPPIKMTCILKCRRSGFLIKVKSKRLTDLLH